MFNSILIDLSFWIFMSRVSHVGLIAAPPNMFSLFFLFFQPMVSHVDLVAAPLTHFAKVHTHFIKVDTHFDKVHTQKNVLAHIFGPTHKK